jgi:hypothetical protein
MRAAEPSSIVGRSRRRFGFTGIEPLDRARFPADVPRARLALDLAKLRPEAEARGAPDR